MPLTGPGVHPAPAPRGAPRPTPSGCVLVGNASCHGLPAPSSRLEAAELSSSRPGGGEAGSWGPRRPLLCLPLWMPPPPPPPAAGDSLAFQAPSSRSRLEVDWALLASFPKRPGILGSVRAHEPICPEARLPSAPQSVEVGMQVSQLCRDPAPRGGGSARPPCGAWSHVSGVTQPSFQQGQVPPFLWPLHGAWHEDPLSPLWAQGRARCPAGASAVLLWEALLEPPPFPGQRLEYREAWERWILCLKGHSPPLIGGSSWAVSARHVLG